MRTKKKKLELHKASTHEILVCLSENFLWSKFLLGRNKVYDGFLQKLINKKFYKDSEEKISIKNIASELGFKTTDVTKWIAQIYDDIYELNETEKELFRSEGIRHDLYFKYFEDRAFFSLWLPQSPKEFEKFDFYFIKAKVGTAKFWVKEVCHNLEGGDYWVSITLEGDGLNKYRELLVDKGLFYGVLHFMDVYDKYSFEIDKELKAWYKR